MAASYGASDGSSRASTSSHATCKIFSIWDTAISLNFENFGKSFRCIDAISIPNLLGACKMPLRTAPTHLFWRLFSLHYFERRQRWEGAVCIPNNYTIISKSIRKEAKRE